MTSLIALAAGVAAGLVGWLGHLFRRSRIGNRRRPERRKRPR